MIPLDNQLNYCYPSVRNLLYVKFPVCEKINRTTVGQKLIEVYPDLEYDVKRHLDRLHTRWEELVELVRHISNVIGQDNKEYEAKQTFRSVSCDKLPPPDELDMTTLQTQIKEFEKRLKDYADRISVINILKNQASAPDFSQREEFSAIISDLERRLSALNEPLNQKVMNLQLLQTSTKGMVELTLEGAWVREKLSQIENLSKALELDPLKAYQIGQRLMVIHCLQRQLKSHILEANNRRPRVKALCKNPQSYSCLIHESLTIYLRLTEKSNSTSQSRYKVNEKDNFKC
uniref:Uncharacterized protein n=1 Tax=Trichobilharzia regenti TaxID=157069 RepID=A0AA85JQF4_TRIRE|nr:unnamed protein product [Trichobilharzia regenti]